MLERSFKNEVRSKILSELHSPFNKILSDLAYKLPLIPDELIYLTNI